MRVIKGLAILMIWVLGLPIAASLALESAWGPGGIDNSDTPSTAASLRGWAILLVGIALLVVSSVAIIRGGGDQNPRRTFALLLTAILLTAILVLAR